MVIGFLARCTTQQAMTTINICPREKKTAEEEIKCAWRKRRRGRWRERGVGERRMEKTKKVTIWGFGLDFVWEVCADTVGQCLRNSCSCVYLRAFCCAYLYMRVVCTAHMWFYKTNQCVKVCERASRADGDHSWAIWQLCVFWKEKGFIWLWISWCLHSPSGRTKYLIALKDIFTRN